MVFTMTQFWAVALIIFLIVEGVTFGLASIWFALGALAALISSLFYAPVWLQITWFVLVSAATLIATRPLVKRFVHSKRQPTNADKIIGSFGVVTEEINNLAGNGAVHIGGKTWTARTKNSEIIPIDTTVKAEAIEGVKLIVSVPPAEDKQREEKKTFERNES